jgi:hypothetical protein
MTNDTMTQGMVAAVLARIDEALQQLRTLPTTSSPELDLAGYYMRLHHQQSIQEMRAQGYKTNDIVEIPVNILEALQASEIHVNGVAVDLEARETLLMFVLARQAKRLGRSQEVNSPSTAKFLSVSSIIEEIDRLKEEAGLGDMWQNAIDTDVHKAISSLRSKLEIAGLSRSLIEGKRRNGYRLSTPAWNIMAG